MTAADATEKADGGLGVCLALRRDGAWRILLRAAPLGLQPRLDSGRFGG